MLNYKSYGNKQIEYVSTSEQYCGWNCNSCGCSCQSHCVTKSNRVFFVAFEWQTTECVNTSVVAHLVLLFTVNDWLKSCEHCTLQIHIIPDVIKETIVERVHVILIPSVKVNIWAWRNLWWSSSNCFGCLECNFGREEWGPVRVKVKPSSPALAIAPTSTKVIVLDDIVTVGKLKVWPLWPTVVVRKIFLALFGVTAFSD